MPFRSQAQRRLFYARPDLRKYVAEFERDTPAKLPERVKDQKNPHRKEALRRLAKKRS